MTTAYLHPAQISGYAYLAPLTAPAAQSTSGVSNAVYIENGRLKRSATGSTAPVGKRLRVA